MSRIRLGLTAALLLLVLLLATAPARLLSWVVPPEQLALEGASGTVWRGQASRAMVAAGSGYLHLGAVHWTLSPLTLFILSPELHLDSVWGTQRLAGDFIYRGEQQVSVTDLDARLPATIVKHWLPLELTGYLLLQVPLLVLEEGLPSEVSGRIIWENGGWVSPQGQRTLGSYAVDIQQLPGGDLLGEVITLGGDLEASGQVSLSGRDYRVDILIGGPGLSDPQLQQALQLVAIPEADRFRVRLEGSL